MLKIQISDLFPFPDFIIQLLEQQVCTLNWDVGFVIQTMNEIGVPLPRLLEVYDQLFKSRVRKMLSKIKLISLFNSSNFFLDIVWGILIVYL
jgi:hypothetical protein